MRTGSGWDFETAHCRVQLPDFVSVELNFGLCYSTTIFIVLQRQGFEMSHSNYKLFTWSHSKLLLYGLLFYTLITSAEE